MIRARSALVPLLLAGCAPMMPSGPPLPPPDQQPVRSAYGDVPAPAVPPELVAGRITAADYPREARANRAEGEVAVVLLVRPDGRVGDCRIDRSSGDPSLDATTCRLIQQPLPLPPGRGCVWSAGGGGDGLGAGLVGGRPDAAIGRSIKRLPVLYLVTPALSRGPAGSAKQESSRPPSLAGGCGNRERAMLRPSGLRPPPAKQLDPGSRPG